MQANTQTIVGSVLMGGCGSAIATHLSLNVLQTVLLAGFALGIALLGQAPTLALRKRVAQLEAQVSSSSGAA
jgi:hypothetical protein